MEPQILDTEGFETEEIMEALAAFKMIRGKKTIERDKEKGHLVFHRMKQNKQKQNVK